MGGKKILVVPLNWGLGHTTRLIPIIRELINCGFAIYFGGSKPQIKLMKQEFKKLQYISFPAMQIRFGRQKYQIISLLIQIPRFIFQIANEHRFTKKLIERERIDMIFSDNVYGIWNKKAYTIFITHQLSIRMPRSLNWMHYPVNYINKWFIKKFNECWIPDIEGSENLAGELSKSKRTQVQYKYIGLLSRFSYFKKPSDTISFRKNSILILLSGPEPQRTFFEKLIAEQLSGLPSEVDYTLIRGLPDEPDGLPGKWKNHLPAMDLHKLIIESEYIICRAGYSTIMDLVVLNRTAILVPTPGQSEQEYLATYLEKKGWFITIPQKNFMLSDALSILRKRKTAHIFDTFRDSSKLRESIQHLITEV